MVVYVQQFALPLDGNGHQKHLTEHQAGLKLLREGIRREYGITLSSVKEELSFGFKGKPFLHNYPDIFFNISHGGNMAACGLDGQPLGVDVEEIHPVKTNIWRRVLTEKEQEYLESTNPDARDREFFRIWTLKESCAKAFGLGLAMDFTGIECILIPEKQGHGQKNPSSIWESQNTVPLMIVQEKTKQQQKGEIRKEHILENVGEDIRMREVTVHLLTESWKQELLAERNKDNTKKWDFLEEKKKNSWHFFQVVLENRYVVSCCCLNKAGEE